MLKPIQALASADGDHMDCMPSRRARGGGQTNLAAVESLKGGGGCSACANNCEGFIWNGGRNSAMISICQQDCNTCTLLTSTTK